MIRILLDAVVSSLCFCARALHTYTVLLLLQFTYVCEREKTRLEYTPLPYSICGCLTIDPLNIKSKFQSELLVVHSTASFIESPDFFLIFLFFFRIVSDVKIEKFTPGSYISAGIERVLLGRTFWQKDKDRCNKKGSSRSR